jgi:type II secretory pathway component PulM
MNKANLIAWLNKILRKPLNKFMVYSSTGFIALFLLVMFWLFILQPFQHQIESRLQQYPIQLVYIQDLNRNLLLYKNKELPTIKMSEGEFLIFKNKLVTQGIQFKFLRLENTSPPQINLQINEIEFSRWLMLVEDFRKKNGLYVDHAIIKKNSLGIVQVTATLVQAQ